MNDCTHEGHLPIMLMMTFDFSEVQFRAFTGFN